MTMVSTTHEFYRLKGFFDHWSSLYAGNLLTQNSGYVATAAVAITSDEGWRQCTSFVAGEETCCCDSSGGDHADLVEFSKSCTPWDSTIKSVSRWHVVGFALALPWVIGKLKGGARTTHDRAIRIVIHQ